MRESSPPEARGPCRSHSTPAKKKNHTAASTAQNPDANGGGRKVMLQECARAEGRRWGEGEEVSSVTLMFC